MGNFDFFDFYFSFTRLYGTLTNPNTSTRTCLKRTPLSFLSVDSIVYVSAASFLDNTRFSCAERGSLSVYAWLN